MIQKTPMMARLSPPFLLLDGVAQARAGKCYRLHNLPQFTTAPRTPLLTASPAVSYLSHKRRFTCCAGVPVGPPPRSVVLVGPLTANFVAMILSVAR